MDQLEAKPIRGTESDSRYPFFSPDGQWIGFWDTTGQLKKVSVGGGPPVALCQADGSPVASWGPDDTIVFAQGQKGVWKVSASGGTPEILVTMDSNKGEMAHRPQILPGGQALLFTLRTGGMSWDEAQIVVQSLETGERKVLINGGRDARYAPTGHLVYAREDTLLAVAFDPGRLEVTGGPVPIVEGVAQMSTIGLSHWSFSDLGSLVYAVDTADVNRTLVWVDRAGRSQPVTETKRRYSSPRFSPDGRLFSVTIREKGGPNIWIYEIARGIFTPLTFDNENMWAIWTPDGRKLAYHSHRIVQDIFWQPVDGSYEAELLTTAEYTQNPTSWSPDGVLAYCEGSDGTGATVNRDIWVFQPNGDSEPRKFLATQFDECHAMFSPDGQWIAFTSNQSGQAEVYVKPYATESQMVQISTDGGTEPTWVAGGTELIYRNENKWMVASVRTQPTFNAETPTLLFEQSYLGNDNASNYDVSPDGQRFVMVKEGDQESEPPQIHVVLNWFEELKRLVPTP